jgi:M6 family metalloprotease-like protein
MKKISLLLWTLVMVLGSLPVSGALLWNVPVTVMQPDGETLRLLASGDEFYNWLHDAKGYTIVQDPETGYYEYALLEDGILQPSGFPVSSLASVNERVIVYLQIPPGLKTSWEKRIKPKDLMPGGAADLDRSIGAPKTGTINNIIVFIRFNDEAEFTDAISTYEAMFNSSTSGANSMSNYFREASYSLLTIQSYFYPSPSTLVRSYKDSHVRNYYKPYNASTNPDGYSDDTQRTDREHALLKDAVNSVSSSIPPGLNVDGDGDGMVDNVCFIVYGGPTAWNTLLWPHKWSLYSYTVYINGKRVYTYNFQLQTSLQSSGVGVLCHEMFHSLGAPDLYHYSYDGLQPAYMWDIMENNLNPPQHMSAYMKYKYGGWIASIPLISNSGTYTLSPLTSSTNNCYRIASPNSSTQFFVIEYRKKTGVFENSIPGSGAIIWRYDTRYTGNANGPPDELYAYRPNGTRTVNGNPSNANFGAHVGRTAINDSTNPSSFLQDGSAGGLNISNIGAANGTISFGVAFNSCTLSVTSSVDVDLTISPNDLLGRGSGTTPLSRSYSLGTRVTITAPQTPEVQGAHYRFTGWSGDASGTNTTITLTMNSMNNIQVNYIRQYHLTIVSGTGGTTNPAPGNYLFDTGAVVSVTASPNTHYRFLNWSGSATGSANPVSLTVDGDETVTANFERFIYPPSNAAAQKVLNRSLSQAEYINIINWEANANNIDIASYKIYLVEGSQRTEVASLAADKSAFTYWHRKVDKNKEYTYAIVAVNREPREGDAATVVVQ